MGSIQSFRDLDVYQLPLEQAGEVLRLSHSFPRDERFALSDQIRTEEEFRSHDGQWQHIGAMLQRMVQRSDDFCQTIRRK